uniref:Uncharacterized protein n=1 Tax=Steinernema glaseri TaxID=37863 RepID=A0A1I7YTT9_9BILA
MLCSPFRASERDTTFKFVFNAKIRGVTTYSTNDVKSGSGVKCLVGSLNHSIQIIRTFLWKTDICNVPLCVRIFVGAVTFVSTRKPTMEIIRERHGSEKKVTNLSKAGMQAGERACCEMDDPIVTLKTWEN